MRNGWHARSGRRTSSEDGSTVVQEERLISIDTRVNQYYLRTASHRALILHNTQRITQCVVVLMNTYNQCVVVLTDINHTTSVTAGSTVYVLRDIHHTTITLLYVP